MVDNLMRSDHCIVNPIHTRYYMALPCFHVEIRRCSLFLPPSLPSLSVSLSQPNDRAHIHRIISLNLEELNHIF